MPVTWLHISDFHLRSGDPYDRDVVLRALINSVADYRNQGRCPDVIFATGDIAFSGKPQEYEIGTQFFTDLLAAAKLDKNRLFVIPGNHDADRDLGIDLVRTLDSRERADNYFREGRPKLHLTQKLGAYLAWHNKFFEGIRKAPDDSTCGPVELLSINGRRLGILPLNSALFCQGDDDHDKLWIGRRCLDTALSELNKLEAEMNVVLIHHPLDWIAAIEGSNIQGALESSAHILLRGHLHETRVETVVSPEGELFRCAAGAAYQTRKWPNRALYTALDGSELTIFPIRYEDAPKEIWTTDPSFFPREPNHQKTFQLGPSKTPKAVASPQTRAAPLPRFRSNITSRGNRPFVGRDQLIAEIAAAFYDTSRANVVVLHGPPGVGKSELAREFARLNHDRYSGGTFLIDVSKDAIAINLATIGKNILDIDFPGDLHVNDQGLQTFYTLSTAPVLLVYDSVKVFDRISPWLPLAAAPCHILITTLLDQPSPAWPFIEVKPLSRPQSLELVEKLTGGALSPQLSAAIADHAGGLPVQIVPDAATLAYEQRRGRLKTANLTLAQKSQDSFLAAYLRLEQPTRLVLHAAAFLNPQRILASELFQHFSEGLAWTEAGFDRALADCLDLHLLEGVPDPSMHQLFASFLRSTPLSPEDKDALSKILPVQAKRFVQLSAELSTNPADTKTAAALMSYPLNPKAWEALGEPISVEQGETVGGALSEMGRFDEARPWFERAAAEQEKGDVDGRINHQNLGLSLHHVGWCLWSTGQYDEARPWFERAVAEKEKGDIEGRVDHASLGASLHQVGVSLSRTSRFDEAQPWFDRAVAEAEKGDLHGRINHNSLGLSLYQVGYCLSSTGRYDEAIPRFERAVAETEKGDVHGRINHESVGSSLHLVGYCLSRTGRFEEARPRFERAVKEAEKGDVYGRVDHDSLGHSLHQVGYCLSSTGQSEEAQPWYERAVEEKEKGDIFGRIDHESLATTLRTGAACLRKLSLTQQADDWDRRASEIDPKRNAAAAAT